MILFLSPSSGYYIMLRMITQPLLEANGPGSASMLQQSAQLMAMVHRSKQEASVEQELPQEPLSEPVPQAQREVRSWVQKEEAAFRFLFL